MGPGSPAYGLTPGEAMFPSQRGLFLIGLAVGTHYNFTLPPESLTPGHPDRFCRIFYCSREIGDVMILASQSVCGESRRCTLPVETNLFSPR